MNVELRTLPCAYIEQALESAGLHRSGIVCGTHSRATTGVSAAAAAAAALHVSGMVWLPTCTCAVAWLSVFTCLFVGAQLSHKQA